MFCIFQKEEGGCVCNTELNICPLWWPCACHRKPCMSPGQEDGGGAENTSCLSCNSSGGLLTRSCAVSAPLLLATGGSSQGSARGNQGLRWETPQPAGSHYWQCRVRNEHGCKGEKAKCVLLCALKLKAASSYARTGCAAQHQCLNV